MRVVIQRVKRASVTGNFDRSQSDRSEITRRIVAGQTISSISQGLCVLVGLCDKDTDKEVDVMWDWLGISPESRHSNAYNGLESRRFLASASSLIQSPTNRGLEVSSRSMEKSYVSANLLCMLKWTRVCLESFIHFEEYKAYTTCTVIRQQTGLSSG
jgi:hypothetical protein